MFIQTVYHSSGEIIQLAAKVQLFFQFKRKGIGRVRRVGIAREYSSIESFIFETDSDGGIKNIKSVLHIAHQEISAGKVNISAPCPVVSMSHIIIVQSIERIRVKISGTDRT